jgi:hypothetical protein
MVIAVGLSATTVASAAAQLSVGGGPYPELQAAALVVAVGALLGLVGFTGWVRFSLARSFPLPADWPDRFTHGS